MRRRIVEMLAVMLTAVATGVQADTASAERRLATDTPRDEALAQAVKPCASRAPTRATGPGPHDYTHPSVGSRLWQDGDPGEPLFLRARVLDTCGKPVAGARVQILHANENGVHEENRFRTDLDTGERGEFKLLTVYPGYTGGIARHIHFLISHSGYDTLVTRLFFKNDPSVDHGVEDLAMVLEEIHRDGRRGWVATYEFVLPAGAGKPSG